MKKLYSCLILLLYISRSAFAQTTYTITADSVYIKSTGDTAELILENNSQNVQGYLYNKGAGRTAFKKVQLVNVGDSAVAIAGQDTITLNIAPLDIQFTTGDTGFPKNGDSIYTNTAFINKSVKVWREHLLQYTVGGDRISFNDSTGAIQFYPPLYSGERVLVEAIRLNTNVSNTQPVVNAGSNQSITLPTDSVTLTGSATDTSGTITSYSWTLLSGGSATIENPSSATTTVTGLSQGVYTFQLTVTDNHGLQNSANVTVTVNPVPFYDRVLVDLGGHNTGVNGDTAQMTPSNANPSGADINGRHWNNVISDSAAMTLTNDGSTTWVDTAGNTVSDFGISISERPGGTYGSGQSFNYVGYWQEVGDYPPTAVEDNAFFYPSDINVWTFTIPTGRTASITFWGTRNSGGSPRRLDFKLSSDTSFTTGYDAVSNLTYSNGYTFNNLTGTIDIDIRVHPGDSFGYISVIDVKLH